MGQQTSSSREAYKTTTCLFWDYSVFIYKSQHIQSIIRLAHTTVAYIYSVNTRHFIVIQSLVSVTLVSISASSMEDLRRPSQPRRHTAVNQQQLDSRVCEQLLCLETKLAILQNRTEDIQPRHQAALLYALQQRLTIQKRGTSAVAMTQPPRLVSL